MITFMIQSFSFCFLHVYIQISISTESGLNMMTLLKTCLHSLAVILEIKLPVEISDSIKLIEEVLIYLSTLINFVPKRCVICIKQMLKYMFYMNYMCRLKQYEYLNTIIYDVTTSHSSSSSNISPPATEIHSSVIVSSVDSFNDLNNKILITFDAVKKFSIYDPTPVATLAASSPQRSPTSVSPTKFQFPDLLSNENSKQAILASQIKVFEPIVIRCLKVRVFFLIIFNFITNQYTEINYGQARALSK